MRHSEVRGMEKKVQTLNEDYQGALASSVDDHYNYPYSPNTSDEFMFDRNRQQEHSLISFVAAPKSGQKKKKKDKNTANTSSVVEEESANVEEDSRQNRGRLSSREFFDTQFDMEPDNQGKLLFLSNKNPSQNIIGII